MKMAVVLCAAAIGTACGSGSNEPVRVAVAANFLGTLRSLEPAFEEATGHRMVITSGSTGLLYAQIRNGAPFDVLLSADQERPRLLAAEGFGAAAEIFTYASGRLALWSADPQRVDESSLDALEDADFRWLAIAEPTIAPYGLAAKQVLERLGLWQALESRIVRGQSVAQVMAMVETGNADLGLIALSQALAYEGESSYSVVAQGLHDPIRQDAIVLGRGANKTSAREFVEFLRSSAAARIMERSGYATSAQTR
jgi:molybdate transport system substrate-binding protein